MNNVRVREVTIPEFYNMFPELMISWPQQISKVVVSGSWAECNSTELGAKITHLPSFIRVWYKIKGTGETGVYVR